MVHVCGVIVWCVSSVVVWCGVFCFGGCADGLLLSSRWICFCVYDVGWLRLYGCWWLHAGVCVA